MKTSMLCVLFCVATAYAGYAHHGGQEQEHQDYFAPANYKFEYAVNDPHTGDKKQQYEVRHGDVVKGAYSLHEPDGTIRVVEYTSHPHTGFNAIVKRIGHAVHPQGYKKYDQGAGAGSGYGGYSHGGATSDVGTTKYGAGDGGYY